MPDATCRVEVCSRPVRAKGLCKLCHQQLMRTGSTERKGRGRWGWGGHGAGSDSPLWTGDDVSYSGLHQRIHNARGSAVGHTCRCGNPAGEWALNLDAPEIIERDGRRYSLDVMDYVPLCVPCHRGWDLKGERRWTALKI